LANQFAFLRRVCLTPIDPLLTPAHNAAAMRSVSDLAALDATHHISRVVASIRSGEVKVGKDGHLRLPSSLQWPIATNNVLFVRKFYAPLFEKVLDWCKARKPGELDSAQRRIVTGQPGIGKSVWV
jgi:hypothetical protein